MAIEKRILDIISSVSQLPLYPLYSDKTGEQIIYTETPVSDDGVIEVYRLELNIICKTLDKANTVDKNIRKALLNGGDLKKIGLLNIELNGGGTLISEIGVHRLIYFTISGRVS